MASPSPHIASDGRLTAGTNIPYDIPSGNDDLATLPLRQRGLIKIILSDLPPNAPNFLRTAFKGYDEELLARGSQPILGLLNDITSIVETCISSPTSAREWLEDGMHAAIEKFLDNHSEMRKHFPLDPKRERAYEQISIDDDGAEGAALSRPFQDVASASGPAGQAGITTDDFVRIIDKMTDYAKTISTLPINGQITSARKTVSAKKRLLLSGLGFFERAYNLLGSTASLVSQPEAVVLAAALRRAIELLGKFVISL